MHNNDVRPGLGRLGEQLAAEHLLRRGYKILERNYRTRAGEIDIVAYAEEAIVFCEVKTRRVAPRHGSALEAVHPGKRMKVRRMASRWLVERRDRPFSADLRFDVIGITLDAADRLVSLDHLEGAF